MCYLPCCTPKYRFMCTLFSFFDISVCHYPLGLVLATKLTFFTIKLYCINWSNTDEWHSFFYWHIIKLVITSLFFRDMSLCHSPVGRMLLRSRDIHYNASTLVTFVGCRYTCWLIIHTYTRTLTRSLFFTAYVTCHKPVQSLLQRIWKGGG